MEPITSAHPPDIDALRALLGAAGLPHADLTEGHLTHFLVVREGDTLAGAVGLEVHGRAALLRSLVVAPERRGEGLGVRLVEAAEAHARAQGVAAIWLLTETAAPVFATRGYAAANRARAPVAIRQTAEFAALCPASAVCMTKRL